MGFFVNALGGKFSANAESDGGYPLRDNLR
jgi:hypothetical protein